MAVEIGTVLKPRGLKGELKIGITYNHPEILTQIRSVIIQGRSYAVLRGSVQNGFGYLTLAGIDTIEKAEPLRNRAIEVAESDLQLAPDEVLSSQLIGFAVMHLGKKIGKVVSVENYGGGDFFEIAVTGEGYIQIPNEDDFIAETNLTNRTLTLKPNALQTEMV